MSSPSPAFTIRIPTLEDAPAIGRIHAETVRAAFSAILPAAFLQTVTEQQRTQTWQHILGPQGRGNHPFVLESEGAIRGFVNCGEPINPLPSSSPGSAPDGEIYTLYVSPQEQRRGYGAALFDTARDYLSEAGCSRLIVWTLAESPFRAFYAKLGGELIAEAEEEFAGEPQLNVAFAWQL